MLLAHLGLPRLATDERIGFRLFAAEKLLDAGVDPRELLEGLGIAGPGFVARKAYDPNEPRIPAGQSGGGEWTDGGGDETVFAPVAPPIDHELPMRPIQVVDSGRIVSDALPVADRQRSVHAINGGTVIAAGWQDPQDHNSGLGWRVKIREPDGSTLIYGHMDPETTPNVGAEISEGDSIGEYADPTNGHSSGPHVHVQRYDPSGHLVDPGMKSPLRDGEITTPFGQRDLLHAKPHQGIDWRTRR